MEEKKSEITENSSVEYGEGTVSVEKEKPNKLGKEILSFVILLLLVFVLSRLIVTFVGQRTDVNGESMENTLHDGDILIVDKISYRFQEPERFDIIVFPYLHAEDTYYIKRIIGLPGETIHIDEMGRIYINGEVLEESYGKEVIEPFRRLQAEGEIQLDSQEYFVLGDNRNASKDSRDPQVGNIKADNIIGKAWLRVFPFRDFGLIRHQ